MLSCRRRSTSVLVLAALFSSGAAPPPDECRPAYSGCLLRLADSLLVRTGDDVLVQLEQRTGRELRRRPITASSRLALDPSRAGLYVASDEDIIALDDALRLRWIANLRSQPSVWSPLVGRDFVVVDVAGARPQLPPAARRFAVLDAVTGRLLWSADGIPPAVLSGDHVLLRDGVNLLVAREGRSGRIVWQKPVGPGTGRVAVAEGVALAADERGLLVALSAASGEPRWTSELPDGVMVGTHGLHAGAAAGSAVVVAPVEAWRVRVVSFDLLDGHLRWTSAPLWAEDIAPEHRAGEWQLYERPDATRPEICRAQAPSDYALAEQDGRLLRERRRVPTVRRRPPEALVLTSTASARFSLRAERDGGLIERLDRSNRSLWRFVLKPDRAGCVSPK